MSVALLARFAGTMGGRTSQVVDSKGMDVTVRYSESLSTSTRCPWHSPQLIVFMAAASLATCCFNTFMEEFKGWPWILSIGMGAMMAWTASHTAALLVMGDDMVVLCCDEQMRLVEW